MSRWSYLSEMLDDIKHCSKLAAFHTLYCTALIYGLAQLCENGMDTPVPFLRVFTLHKLFVGLGSALLVQGFVWGVFGVVCWLRDVGVIVHWLTRTPAQRKSSSRPK